MAYQEGNILVKFFFDIITSFYRPGSGAFAGSIDDLFPSMLYITPNGWFRKMSVRGGKYGHEVHLDGLACLASEVFCETRSFDEFYRNYQYG